MVGELCNVVWKRMHVSLLMSSGHHKSMGHLGAVPSTVGGAQQKHMCWVQGRRDRWKEMSQNWTFYNRDVLSGEIPQISSGVFWEPSFRNFPERRHQYFIRVSPRNRSEQCNCDQFSFSFPVHLYWRTQVQWKGGRTHAFATEREPDDFETKIII